MGGSDIGGHEPSFYGEPVTQQPEVEAKRRNGAIWMQLIGAGVVVAGLGWVAHESNETPDTDFLISGPIPGAEPSADVEGAVDLKCLQRGERAIVNATVRLVTVRDTENGAARGRIVQSQAIFDGESCDTATDLVTDDPRGVIEDVVVSVRSGVTKITGDGKFPTAEKFESIIEDAKEDGIKVVPIEMMG